MKTRTEFVQMGQQILGKNQGIGGGIFVFKALPGAFGPDELVRSMSGAFAGWEAV